MSILITGIAGFVGSNLARRLLTSGKSIFGVDNLSLGRIEVVHRLVEEGVRFERVDIADFDSFQSTITKFHGMDPITEIWHLAANSDIPKGIQDSSVDLRDTFITTLHSLKLMRQLGIPRMLFSSTSAIYGDLGQQLLHENIGPLLPISNYGAMKLASEAAISAAVEAHLVQALIFRFPNVIGVPATHGVILDFVRRLKANPQRLEVLGDGTQQKAYLHESELVDAMLHVSACSSERIGIYNVGPVDDGVTVRFIAEETVRQAAPGAEIAYGSGGRGWVGDVPRFRYSVGKLLGLGWQPRLGSADAVRLAVRQIVAQEHGRK